MDVTSLGTTSRTLHSATHAPNSPPTSRLSPLFRTLSEMGQAATKLGHGGACVATSKRAPRGIRFCLPRSREKISRRCSLSSSTSPATREATGALVAPHARLASLDRDRAHRRSRARRTLTRLDREPGSVGVSSVVHAFFIPACRIPIRHRRQSAIPSSKLMHLVDSTTARRLAHPSLPSSVPFRQTSRRPDGASPCTKTTSPIAPARRARAWTSPPPAAAPSTSATRPRESPSTSPSGTRWPIRPFAEASVIPARLGRRGRAVPRARTNTSTRNECVNTSRDLRTYDPPRPARRGIFQPSVLLSLIRETSLHRPRASLSKSLTFASPWRAPRRAHRARRVSDSYYIFVRHSPLVSRSLRGA